MQNFRSNNRKMVPLREDAAKRDESDEERCCGVSWYPSRIPLAVYANNRCKISLSRNSTVDEELRNLTSRKTSSSVETVRRCSYTRSQPVTSVRPALVTNCFGKRENKNSVTNIRLDSYAVRDRCASCNRHSHRNVSHFDPNNVSLNCASAICGSCRDDRSVISCSEIHEQQSTESTLDRFQKFRFGGDRTGRGNAGRRGSAGSHKKKAQRNSDKTVNLKKLTDKLKQGSSTRVQEAATSGDSPAPFVDELALADKQPASDTAHCTQIVIPLKNEDHTLKDSKEDIFEGVNLKLTKPESRTIVGSYYQRSIPFRSASFSQVFYSPEDHKYVKNSLRKQNSRKGVAPNAENSSATLPRANCPAQTVEERKENVDKTFLNSFSRELPENLEERSVSDGDYPKDLNELLEERTTSCPIELKETFAETSANYEDCQVRLEQPSENDVENTTGCENKLIEPILGDGAETSVQKELPVIEGALSNDSETNAQKELVEQVISNGTEVEEKKELLEEVLSDNEEEKKPVEQALSNSAGVRVKKDLIGRALSDGDGTSAAEELVSLVESEPAQALCSSVVPIMAPTDPSNTFPQPPKRNKHKHKHRNRYLGRLYFSDENIFSPCEIENQPLEDVCDSKPIECETISVTITTPQISDYDVEKQLQNESNFAETISNTATKEASKSEKVENVESCSTEIINHEGDSDSQQNPTTPSSPEDALKPYWPSPTGSSRERKLTPQTSTERDDEPECVNRHRKYHLFTRGDSFSEADSDQGDKRSISPAGYKDGRLSPSPYSCDLSDSDSRKSRHSPVPYTKRPLRGPYLEMIVNEQKKPEKAKNTFRNLQIFDSQFPPSQPLVHDRAVDDYYLRRSNTSPHSIKLIPASRLPKRKISANIPLSSPSSLKDAAEEKTVIHHQRTTSSPSQLEFYPSQLPADQSPAVPSQQLLQQLLRGSSERSLIQDMYPKTSYKDTRSHIVVELYDTEHSYVDSLQILVTKYLLPLKSRDCNNLIEPYVVEEIFYKIPEILSYHEIFLEELRIRLEGWNTSKCIGDIFLDTFTKPAVIDAYIGFITNWKAAKESIKQTCQMKPAFARFLEDMAREHKGKLALDSLLIMPVQRIPRYELLIQSLLKHTEICHPDYDKLQEALRQVHDLAIRINCTERDTLELENIEKLIDGLHNLVAADRGFLRYDLVIMTSGQQMSRKERALFLFNDLLLITSMKRRSSTAKKPIPSNPNITNILESNKYKLLSKIPLEYLDIEKVRDENVRKMLQEIEFLKSDVNILSQIVELVATLHCPNEQMEDTLRDMQSALNKQLVDKQVSDSQLSHLELILTTRNNVEHLSIIFSTPEKRTNWEETFLEAKARLNVGDNRRLNPEFLTSVPVRKTRAGLQFTCAAASYNQHDVWVCNSDGYVGQVCILTMSPEPAVTSCNGVCNARISSVTCVPLSKSVEKYLDSPDTLGHVNPAVSLGKSEHFDDITESIPVENLEHSALDIQLKSSSSSDDDDDDDLIDEHKDADASPSEIIVESTMWLGTEDGVVHIYNCADSLRVKRNRLKIQHNFAVFCILYVDKSVFVSLANGDVYVYYWTTNFGWNITEPTILTVGCVTTPVTRMFLACGKLWCICQNIIKIVNVHTLHIENSFSVIGENNRAITSVAVSGFSVYLSLQNSAVLRLVHGVTYDILAEINVAPAVTKMLSGTDDIIRQHKAACLRVTSLLACKELLWIGTSAGVILTLTMPSVKENTTKIPSVPHPVGLPHGHTGHVRFLTLVKCQTKAKAENGRRIGKTTESKADTNKMLVISGGDGYEDFRSSSVSEIAGREDSTNHLLIWRS